MKNRSLGVTVLAFSTFMVAIYSQYAAISLLLTGSVFTVAGSFVAMVTLLTGAVFLGLTATAYAVGFGLWTRRSWSWNGAMAVFLTLFVANIFLSILATNFVSAVIPSVGVIVAVVYLQRPAVRAEILGIAAPVTSTAPASDGLEVARPAH
jgi:hypothetical protein